MVKVQGKFCTEFALCKGPTKNTVWNFLKQCKEMCSIFIQQKGSVGRPSIRVIK
jgi:hypothetical protein